MTRDGKSHDVASGYWLMRGAGFALGSTMHDLAPGLYDLSIEVAGEAIAAVPDVLVLAPGDVNRDGFFDSTDMVHMMTAGKYETGTPASADEGDVNGDGVFTSADIVTMMTGAPGVKYGGDRYSQKPSARDEQQDAHGNWVVGNTAAG